MCQRCRCAFRERGKPSRTRPVTSLPTPSGCTGVRCDTEGRAPQATRPVKRGSTGRSRTATARPPATRPSCGVWPTPSAAVWTPPSTTRCPRPDLPQVHLRRLREGPRQAGVRARPRGRPRRRRRVPRPKHLLGAARGALGAPEGASQAANHRVGPACPSRPSWTGTRGSRRKHCACSGGRSCRATRRASTCSSTSSDAASAVRAQFRHSTGVLVQQAWVPVIAEHHLSQENGAMPRKGRDYGAELIRWLRIRAIAAVYHGFPRSSRER